ncbi:hypothetical protein ACWGRM_29430, partial [Streptomyces kronopolitis]
DRDQRGRDLPRQALGLGHRPVEQRVLAIAAASRGAEDLVPRCRVGPLADGIDDTGRVQPGGHPDVGYPEPGTDVRAVATAWLVSLRAGIAVPATRTAALAIAAEADHDPDSAQGMARIVEDRRAALNKLLEPSGLQITADQYTLLYGPLLARVFFDRTEATDTFIDTLVTQWLTTLDHTPGQP